MGRDLAVSSPAARDVFARADDALGFGLAEVAWAGPADRLTATEVAQPVLLTHAIAVLAGRAIDVPATFAAAAGHSLGEWTALVAAEAISFEDAVRLVHLRGRLMQDAVPAGVGAMTAIIGLAPEAVAAVCREATSDAGVVVPATVNGANQVVISGARAAVARAAELAVERGALKVLPVDVSAPFHSPLMAPAAAPLADALASATVTAPRIRVRSASRAVWLDTPALIREALIEQMTQPILWMDCMRSLVAAGITSASVVGPGRQLARIVQRMRLGLTVEVLS